MTVNRLIPVNSVDIIINIELYLFYFCLTLFQCHFSKLSRMRVEVKFQRCPSTLCWKLLSSNKRSERVSWSPIGPELEYTTRTLAGAVRINGFHTVYPGQGHLLKASSFLFILWISSKIYCCKDKMLTLISLLPGDVKTQQKCFLSRSSRFWNYWICYVVNDLWL